MSTAGDGLRGTGMGVLLAVPGGSYSPGAVQQPWAGGRQPLGETGIPQWDLGVPMCLGNATVSRPCGDTGPAQQVMVFTARVVYWQLEGGSSTLGGIQHPGGGTGAA